MNNNSGRHADTHKIMFFITFLSPFAIWLAVARKMDFARVTKPKIKGFVELIPNTFEHPQLYLFPVLAFVISIIAWVIVIKFNEPEFRGFKYKYRLRGSDMVSVKQLNELTKEKEGKQITLATVKLPFHVENLQTLIVGAIGASKTVILSYAIYTILLRGDRQVIVDPDGHFLSMFFKDNDVVLNPFDARSPGWSIFNEIREVYDYEKYAYSLVPLGKSSQEEEWNGYGRLLVTEVMRKLHETNNGKFDQLVYWCTITTEEDLEEFCKGTRAESLFTGTDRTIGSARFVLSNKLSSQLYMPAGDFSLREFLEDETKGNLYITWTEDQMSASKTLISTFIDVICNAVLSLPENEQRRLWLHTDELASLDKLNALMPATTKGRRKGFRIISCLQALSQLDAIWGKDDATTLRASYRNLIALGTARSDDYTAEALSKAIGDIEVVRDHESKTQANKGNSQSSADKGEKDRLVTASEISNLGDREGYIALTRGYPVAKFKVPITNFKKRHPAFVPRRLLGD